MYYNYGILLCSYNYNIEITAKSKYLLFNKSMFSFMQVHVDWMNVMKK
jgi:hypothetical protein